MSKRLGAFGVSVWLVGAFLLSQTTLGQGQASAREKGDNHLRVRLVDLSGKPLAHKEVWIKDLIPYSERQYTDENGVAVLDGLPDRPFKLYANVFNGIGSWEGVLPGEMTLACPQAYGPTIWGNRPAAHGWKAARWLSGKPFSPDETTSTKAGGYLFCFPVPSPERSLQDTVAQLIALHRKHAAEGLKTVILLPPGHALDVDRFKGIEDLFVGIDAPILKEEGSPTYTRSLWTYRLAFFVGFDGRFRGVWPDAPKARPDDIEPWLADRMAERPAEWVIEAVDPDNLPVPDARATMRLWDWEEVARDELGRLKVSAVISKYRGALVVWREEGDMVSVVRVTPAMVENGILPVKLERGVSLVGRVVNGDGKPMVGVTVDLFDRKVGYSADENEGYGVGATDADGRFAIHAIPTGAREVSVSVNPEGWTYTFKEVGISSGSGPVDVGDLVVRRMDRRLRGIVLNTEGQPVQGAWVNAGSRHKTGPEGRFEADNLPRGEVHVRAEYRVGEERLKAIVKVPEGQDFALLVPVASEERRLLEPNVPKLRIGQWIGGGPPTDLERRVRLVYFVARERRADHDKILRRLGELARTYAREGFAAVAVYPANTRAETVRRDLDAGLAPALAGIDEPIDRAPDVGWTEALLAARGQTDYLLRSPRSYPTSVVLVDRYDRTASSLAEHESIVARIARQGTRVDFDVSQFPKEQTIRQFLDATDVALTVLGPDGKPVAGANVALVNPNKLSSAESGPDGKLFLPGILADKPAPIFVYHLERGLAGRVEVQGKGHFEATVRLAAPRPVTGRVVTRDGKPLAGVRTTPLISFENRHLSMAVPHSERTFTGQDGRFRLDWIPNDIQLHLFLQLADYTTEQRTVVARKRALGEIVLSRTNRRATFRIVGLDGKPLPGANVAVAHGLVPVPMAGGRISIAKFPDKPVKVLVVVEGSAASSAAYELGPGDHILAALSADQRQSVLDTLEGKGDTPLWRVSRWVEGEPVPFEARSPCLAIVASDKLDDAGFVALARSLRGYATRVPRRALILPLGTEESTVKKVAEILEGFSIGIDAPVAPNCSKGYSQIVSAVDFNAAVRFTGYARLPNMGRPSLFYSSIVMEPVPKAIVDSLKRREEQMTKLFSSLPPTPDEFITELKKSGELVAEKPDPIAKGGVWLILRTGLAMTSPEEGFAEFKSVLGMDEYRVAGLAFAEKSVYVGTDAGLIVFDRETKSWNRIAPAGDYRLMQAPVKSVKQTDDRITVTFKPPDGNEVARTLENGRWE